MKYKYKSINNFPYPNFIQCTHISSGITGYGKDKKKALDMCRKNIVLFEYEEMQEIRESEGEGESE